MAAITYRETNNFTAAELERLRGLGFGPVPGAAEAGHGCLWPLEKCAADGAAQ